MQALCLLSISLKQCCNDLWLMHQSIDCVEYIAMREGKWVDGFDCMGFTSSDIHTCRLGRLGWQTGEQVSQILQ